MIRITKEPVRCPVGDERIGLRWIQAEAEAYCVDCDFTYFFHAHENTAYGNRKGKPVAEKVYCGPGGCTCR